MKPEHIVAQAPLTTLRSRRPQRVLRRGLGLAALAFCAVWATIPGTGIDVADESGSVDEGGAGRSY